MDIQLSYFGMLTDVTGCSTEMIQTNGATIGDLLLQLTHKYPDLKGKQYQVAQNQEIVKKDALISGAVIALLPPFSGG